MSRIDRAINVFTAICGVFALGLLIRRDVAVHSERADVTGAGIERLSDAQWDQVLRASRRVLGAAASTRIVVFTDLECPACAEMHRTLQSVDSARPGEVDIRYVHYPLTMHRYATAAAAVAECAAASAAFASFVTEVFRQQRRLGVLGWGQLAKAGGVADTARAAGCATAEELPALVEAGVALGRELQVRFTPTVILDGARSPVSPSLGQFLAHVDSARVARKATHPRSRGPYGLEGE